jgi:hypothetical protein
LIRRVYLASLTAWLALVGACAGPADDSGQGSGEAVTANTGSPSATLQGLPAYAALPEIQRNALMRLVAQPTNMYSRAFRRDLATLLADPKFTSASVDAQSKQLWAATQVQTDLTGTLDKDGLLPGALPSYGQVMAPIVPAGNKFALGAATVGHRLGATPARDMAAYEQKYSALLSGSNALGVITADDFDNTGETAALFPLQVDGQSMTVGAPLHDDGSVPGADEERTFPADSDSAGAPLNGHSVQEVAKALSDMPRVNRQLFTDEIDLIGGRAWIDPIAGHLYHRPGMRAAQFATVNPLGSFDVFARPGPEGQGAVDPSTMVHESGHTWSFRTWGFDPTSPGWKAWRAAIAADGLTVSWYAASGPDPAVPGFLEDVAETVLVYCAVRSAGQSGAALGAEMKALYPARWAILESQFPR